MKELATRAVVVLLVLANMNLIDGFAEEVPNIIYQSERGVETFIAKIHSYNPFDEAIEVEPIPIYVADSDDDCPVSDLVPLDYDTQQFIWTKCKKATDDYENYYCFILGTMEHESTFRPKAVHHNKNGTVDRGIMQINSSNVGKMIKNGFISSSNELFNPLQCINCGMYMMDQYIAKFGVTESAYYAYNTGKEKHGSNSNSRKVMQYMRKWKEVIFNDK